MIHYCCVPYCSSRANKNPELSFHTFPRPGKSRVYVETELGSKVLVDRRQVWIKTLKVGKKKISENMRVCSLHFSDYDYFHKERISRKILKSIAIPTKKLPLQSDSEPGPSSRDIRAATRRKKCKKVSDFSQEVANFQYEIIVDQEGQDDIKAAEVLLELMESQSLPARFDGPGTYRDAEVQVNIPKVLTLCELITTDDTLKSFTGVNNFKIFDPMHLSCIIKLGDSIG